MMITKLTAQKLLMSQTCKFMFSKLTKQGQSIVAEMPTVQLPIRAKYQNQDRFSKQLFYSLNNYLHKDRPPRCRYYALEYKNRIYHVFNAYYYPMGRMIGQIATAIRGKNSPHFRNSQADVKNGDVCVIVNAADPLFTGKKLLFKDLKYHTGFVGHLRTHSYKHVLNKKPQLLYYYLLRKFMPKNKVSGKYMQNLKIYRGPTHDIPHLPQFAPDKNIYEYLPEANMQEYIRLNPEVKLFSQSQPGLAKEQFGREFEYVKSPESKLKEEEHFKDDAQDTSKLHKAQPETRTKLNYSPNELAKLRRKEQRILDRYKDVRAPFKGKSTFDTGFLYIKDERKARKMDDYRILADEDLIEEDQEGVEDPFGRKAKDAAAKEAAKEAAKNAKDAKK